jgi:hypothetical protein
LLSAGSAASGVCKKRVEGAELVELAMIGCRIGKKILEDRTPQAFRPGRIARFREAPPVRLEPCPFLGAS